MVNKSRCANNAAVAVYIGGIIPFYIPNIMFNIIYSIYVHVMYYNRLYIHMALLIKYD